MCTSTALEIVKNFVDTNRQKVEFASFQIGMGKPSDEVWDNAVEGIVKHLRAGSDVAFLTEGDTMLYGSFSYVSDRMKIRHPEITVEIIPGVPYPIYRLINRIVNNGFNSSRVDRYSNSSHI